MADEKKEQQEQNEQNEQNEQQEQSSSGPGTGTAVKAVAAAAATGAAALAAKKVMSSRGGTSNGNASNGGSPERKGEGDEGEDSIFSSVISGGWEAAREALLPAAEDAAGAAGEYVAQHGPDVLRDRIVPRFVDSFNEARANS